MEPRPFESGYSRDCRLGGSKCRYSQRELQAPPLSCRVGQPTPREEGRQHRLPTGWSKRRGSVLRGNDGRGTRGRKPLTPKRSFTCPRETRAADGFRAKTAGDSSLSCSSACLPLMTSARHCLHRGSAGRPLIKSHVLQSSQSKQTHFSERRQSTNLRRSPPPPQARGTAGGKKSGNCRFFSHRQTI